MVPLAGIRQTASGSIRKATTKKRSAWQSRNACRKDSSRSLSGCSSGSPCCSATVLTAEGVSFRPRPTALSGTVTTATTSCAPERTSFSNSTEANSGVPINTILIFPCFLSVTI